MGKGRSSFKPSSPSPSPSPSPSLNPRPSSAPPTEKYLKAKIKEKLLTIDKPWL